MLNRQASNFLFISYTYIIKTVFCLTIETVFRFVSVFTSEMITPEFLCFQDVPYLDPYIAYAKRRLINEQEGVEKIQSYRLKPSLVKLPEA